MNSYAKLPEGNKPMNKSSDMHLFRSSPPSSQQSQRYTANESLIGIVRTRCARILSGLEWFRAHSQQGKGTIYRLLGGLEPFYYSIYWECHHPN